MNKNKSVAVIGAGYWGKNLVRNFHNIGVLHTICDHHKETLENFKKLYPDVNVSHNFKSVLENKEIHQIVLATPAIYHYQNTKEALLAGKDVYVEKPFCLNSKEGEELISLSEKHQRILMVGHLLHYHPCVQKLQQIVKSGELGNLQYIVSNRLNMGSFRIEENALWNFAPHDVSVILSLAQQLPTQVICSGADYVTSNIADMAVTLLNFPNGVKAHIFVSWLHPFKEQKLTVVCSQGMIVFDDTKAWGEKLSMIRNHVIRNKGIPLANPAIMPEKIDPPQKEPLREECLHFLQCCMDRKSPLTDGHEGLQVIKVLEAAEESMNTNGSPIIIQHNPYSIVLP